jgi:hypothetical protein
LNRRHADFQSFFASFPQPSGMQSLPAKPAPTNGSSHTSSSSTLSTECRTFRAITRAVPTSPAHILRRLDRAKSEGRTVMRQEVAVTFLRPTETTLFTLIQTQSFSREMGPNPGFRMGPELEMFCHGKRAGVRKISFAGLPQRPLRMMQRKWAYNRNTWLRAVRPRKSAGCT